MSGGLTYKDVGVVTGKKEKIGLISPLIETTFDWFVISWSGGFAGLYDFGAYLQDRRKEKIIRELERKYGEKRTPYILAACWLQYRREMIETQKLRMR